jgi:hypothetical protein
LRTIARGTTLHLVDDAANARDANGAGATKGPAKSEPKDFFVRDNGLALATCGRVFVDVFYAPPTVVRLDELYRQQCALVDRVGRHAVLSIIDPGVGKEMGDDARKRARAISLEMEPHTIGHSFIVLGNGFFSAMARSIIAGIQLVSRTKAPWRVTSDPNDGVTFVAELVRAEGGVVDDVALRALVERLLAPATRAAS